MGKKAVRRVIAMLLVIVSVFSGCVPSIQKGLYADELSSEEGTLDLESKDNTTEEAEEITTEEEISEESGVKTETPIQGEEETDSEEYLDFWSNQSKDEETSESEIEEVKTEISDKELFFIKLNEGGKVTLSTCPDIVCSIWREGSVVYCKTEEGTKEIQQTEEGYYAIPFYKTGSYMLESDVEEGYYTELFSVNKGEFGSKDTFVGDLLIELKSGSKLYLDASFKKGNLSVPTPQRKFRRAQSREGGGVTATVQNKTVGSPGSSCYGVLLYLNGQSLGDYRYAICGYASRSAPAIDTNPPTHYRVGEWVGKNGAFTDPNNSYTKIAALLIAGDVADTYKLGGDNNAIGKFGGTEKGIYISDNQTTNFAVIHAAISTLHIGDASYNNSGGSTQVLVDEAISAAAAWAEENQDILSAVSLNCIYGSDNNVSQDLFSIFYMPSAKLSITKEFDPNFKDIVKPGGVWNKLYEDLTTTFKVESEDKSFSQTFTTDKEGKADPISVPKAGRYKIEEVTPPPNYEKASMKWVNVELGQTKSIVISDKPKGDPDGLKFYKRTDETSASELNNANMKEGDIPYHEAVYKVTYYDVFKGNGNYNIGNDYTKDEKVNRTWYFSPKSGSNEVYFKSTNNLVSYNGHNSANLFFKTTGRGKTYEFPMGTYKIEEVNNPKGTLANSHVYWAQVRANGEWHWKGENEESNGKKVVNVANHKLLIGYAGDNKKVYLVNTPKLTGLSVQKYARGTGTSTPIPGTTFDGITFRLYNLSENQVKTEDISEKVGNVSAPNALNDYVLSNGQSKFTITGLPVGKYAIQEIKGNQYYPITCTSPERGDIKSNNDGVYNGFYAQFEVKADRNNKLYITDSAGNIIRGVDGSANGSNDYGFIGDYGFSSTYQSNVNAGRSVEDSLVASLPLMINGYKLNNGVNGMGAINKEVYGDVGAIKHDNDIHNINNDNTALGLPYSVQNIS